VKVKSEIVEGAPLLLFACLSVNAMLRLPQ